MRLRFHLALFTVCLLAAGDGGRGSVSDLVAAIRKELAQHRGDSRIARDIAKTILLERLDDRTIEALQSEGAGPETVAVLQMMRDGSELLPRPKAPAIPQPPAPSAAQQVQVWEAAHENAVNYTENLPDFICKELVRRYVNGNGRNWKLQDTLTLKLSYFEHREDYKLIMVNNRSTGMSYEQMRGAITEGEFGSMLAAIFALRSRTNRDWDHWTMLRSRPTHVFTFAIARANSDYRITSGTSMRNEAQVKVGQHGFVYIDDETKMVVRLSAVADEFPLGFDVRRVELVLDYDFTDVGGHRYLLPLHSETKLMAPPFLHRNETEFREYRKFSSDATITYDGVKK